MILKAQHIAALLKNEENSDHPLAITPTPILKAEEGGAASIDLRLGTWFVSLRQARMPFFSVEEPATKLAKTQYVPFGADYILHPGSFVLGVTLEWLSLPSNLAAFVVGRSSWGRRGLIIATATGVHPGFKGCLTLELSNVGEIPIAVKPGTTICQLFFNEVKESLGVDQVDRSIFAGLRKPTLGKISLDEVAAKLARANAL